MKKTVIWIIIILALTIIVGIFFYKNYSNTVTENEMPLERLIEIVKPKINVYCDNLESVASTKYNSGDDKYCPTCRNVNDTKYYLYREGESYKLNTTINLIFHWRNDMPGQTTATFLIDKEGKITKDNIKESFCK